jgi:hypothetical protein
VAVRKRTPRRLHASNRYRKCAQIGAHVAVEVVEEVPLQQQFALPDGRRAVGVVEHGIEHVVAAPRPTPERSAADQGEDDCGSREQPPPAQTDAGGRAAAL